jgi:type IX secretion system PorP/SprF family membrane protein
MGLKLNTNIINKGLLTITFASFISILNGQQTPLSTLSYWVFTPSVYNPAIAGSKDFFSMGIISSSQGKPNTQILNANTRFIRNTGNYYFSQDNKDYSNFGMGGSVFHDLNGTSENIGLNASGTYHIPLGVRKLTFLSFGVSAKGVYNTIDSVSGETLSEPSSTFYENLDFGMYLYGATFYSGISVTDLLGNPGKPDSAGLYAIPVVRKYFFTSGYKIVLSRSLNIVLEPSVLISLNDTSINEIADNINPIIKLYLDNFCIGSYFLNENYSSFFFEYRFPRLYLGVFFELPKNTAYFKSSPLIELTAGINIANNKIRPHGKTHW